jgi:hypothetical protein
VELQLVDWRMHQESGRQPGQRKSDGLDYAPAIAPSY